MLYCIDSSAMPCVCRLCMIVQFRAERLAHILVDLKKKVSSVPVIIF